MLDVNDYNANDKYSPIKPSQTNFQYLLSCFSGWICFQQTPSP